MKNQEPAANIVENGNEGFLPNIKKAVMFGIGAFLGASSLLLYRKYFAGKPEIGMQEILLEDRPGSAPSVL